MNSHFFVITPTRLLCQMQANPSGAEFLSTISKFIKRKNILSLLVKSFTKREIRHFSHFQVVVVQWRQGNVQKSRCFPLSSYCFFLLSRLHCKLNILLFTIHCDPSETEYSQCKLNCSCWKHPNVFLLIGSSFVSDKESMVNEPGKCGEIIAVVYELTKGTQEMLFANWAQ